MSHVVRRLGVGAHPDVVAELSAPEDAIARACALANDRNLPVVVDPKARDLSRYRGATVVTPNAKETEEATGQSCVSDAGAEGLEASPELREIARRLPELQAELRALERGESAPGADGASP